MRSRHADCFNHDEDAPGYDADVADESNPIRAGYAAVLDWVVERAGIGPQARVLDLGSGTGNLSGRIAACGELVCVDVSRAMNRLAAPKLAHLDDVSFVEADLLEFFDLDRGCFDAVLSTYAVHHLTEDEKGRFFARVAACLKPGGRAVFGDLMLESEEQASAFVRQFRAAGDLDAAEAVEEEFFWRIDSATAMLRRLGLTVESRRFSELSWGIALQRAVAA